MVVDALVYAGPCLFGGGRSLAELAAEAEASAIDLLLAAPAKPPDYDLPAASTRLALACEESEGRAWCLARVDPWRDDAVAAVERLLAYDAVRGVLVHPWEETVPANHPRVVAVARAAAARGLPVVVEAGYPMLAEALSLADLARQVGGPVVMTRGGQLNMSGLGQQSADLALEAASNLHTLSAGVYRQDWLERAVERFGAERLLHGSGAPVFSLGFELERLRRAAMAGPARQLVLGDNARRLFRLSA